MAKKTKIGKKASEKTKEEFADEISSLTILTSKEVQKLFPKETDREELEEFFKIINEDIDDKLKKIKLVKNIEKVGGAILKIGKKLIATV
ncbi:hypothetical protein [Lutibacter flavus]|uniref:Uncharacterized protein n=1 Tax=Lutibacter flavus TaxID=691689 RepID=A0A238VN79_9FLAO|nr:hypothetical protein [Lutibacter flavus]SNR35193.1 hypothetical protein SAMN04488111_0687 [Lutibacter flavus]